MAYTAARTWATGEYLTAALMNEQLRDNVKAISPVGSLMLRAANYSTSEVLVEGAWLQCNGVAVSRTTYATLFSYLNGLSPALPFGTGDGSTTFNVPDLRGRAAWAEGEHSEVDAMGDSEGVSVGNRSASHHHIYVASGNNVMMASGSAGDVTNYNNSTTGNQSLQDKPAYLVVGSWFIKTLA